METTRRISLGDIGKKLYVNDVPYVVIKSASRENKPILATLDRKHDFTSNNYYLILSSL